MRIITSVATMQQLAQSRQSRKGQIGFVPTMGYLHAGHVDLIRRARQLVGPRGTVVVSIYVNPAQFAPREDLARYPRDFARDRQLCRTAGVDVLFAPDDRQMYPRNGDGAYSTYVVEESLSRGMEGAARPAHFRGVATVVAKLFNIVRPGVAVFGAKDFQQAAIIQRLARDLNFPVKIVVAPTCRELDGLAMSSRNKYLSPAEREQATALWQAIQHARATMRAAKKPVRAAVLAARARRLISGRKAARVDYVEFFDARTLQPMRKVTRGARMALAVFIGQTRLIDNAVL